MSSPITRGEFVSTIDGATVTLTPRPGTSSDTGAVVSSIAVTSTNPPSEFWEVGRMYRVTFERIL